MNFKTVRTRLLPILKYIEAGNYPAKIARMLGLGKPHVAYYVRKLEQADLVRRERRSNIVVYSVTRKGSNFLTGSEGALFGSGVRRLHAAKYRYGIVASGVWPTDWRRVAKMNWTALLGLEVVLLLRRRLVALLARASLKENEASDSEKGESCMKSARARTSTDGHSVVFASEKKLRMNILTGYMKSLSQIKG